MNRKRHLLVVDPIGFNGGSKIATENMLRQLDGDVIRITLLTVDSSSWRRSTFKRALFSVPKFLAQRRQGIPYFALQGLLALRVLIARLRYGAFDIALGASGPGVDLALYIAKPLLGYRLIQLVHGPVAASRTIGRCLQYADEIHYLPSSGDSLLTALAKAGATRSQFPNDRFHILINGLPESLWPSPCQYRRPIIFWAASLLKWKGLQTLIDSLRYLDTTVRPQTHICYIRPIDTSLPVSQAPFVLPRVYWHENPDNIDQLRSKANIFVSTSRNEPFGLSILEALAAGHCALIPQDGAYWDQVLTNGVTCIKYKADDALDLAFKLRWLSQNIRLVEFIGKAAAALALQYTAKRTYDTLKRSLEAGITPNSSGVSLPKLGVTS
jgi:glycosyltransferase involved in cell wall biosynthesis